MKRDEEKTKTHTTSQSRPEQDADLTSASVENAHATGDGAVKKTDELFSSDETNDTSTDTTSY